jgi:hypothetical protein
MNISINEFKFNKNIAHPHIYLYHSNNFKRIKIITDLTKNINPSHLLIITSDKSLYDIYDEYYPDAPVFFVNNNKYCDDLVSRILENASCIINKNLPFNGCVVLDNIIPDYRSNNESIEKNILELLMNSRHYGISLIFTDSKLNKISPEYRLNFDYIYLGYDDEQCQKIYDDEQYQKIYDYYVNVFDTLTVFEQFFTEITKNDTLIVIDNRKQTDKMTDMIFWYKS